MEVVADHGAVGMPHPIHNDSFRNSLCGTLADKIVAETVQSAINEALAALAWEFFCQRLNYVPHQGPSHEVGFEAATARTVEEILVDLGQALNDGSKSGIK